MNHLKHALVMTLFMAIGVACMVAVWVSDTATIPTMASTAFCAGLSAGLAMDAWLRWYFGN